MSQVEVYALRIRRDLSSSERAALLEILPYGRRQRLLRTREDKQVQALCAYGALHLALHRQYDFFGFPPISIAEGGKPYFPDYPHIQFNLSHTDGAVVCAVSSPPVGVDLERSRPPADNILHYGNDFSEWQVLVVYLEQGKTGLVAVIQDALGNVVDVEIGLYPQGRRSHIHETLDRLQQKLGVVFV